MTLDDIRHELIYHLKWTDLLEDDYYYQLSSNKLFSTYSKLQKTLKKSYYNLSLGISTAVSVYVNSKSEKEIKTDYNPFSEEKNKDDIKSYDLDAVACSCLLESIKELKIPNWAIELIDHNLIKNNADSTERSGDRFFISNGLVLIDSYIYENYIYVPLAIVDYERLIDKSKIDMYRLYPKKEYICTINVNHDNRQKLGLILGLSKFSSLIGNTRLEIG